MEKNGEFKDRLVQAINYRRMSAAELSRRTGISESTISQYKSGYAKPKEKKLAILANALHVSPTWLMGLDVPMELEDEKTRERLTAYANKLKLKMNKSFDEGTEMPEALVVAFAYDEAPQHIKDAIKAMLQIKEE